MKTLMIALAAAALAGISAPAFAGHDKPKAAEQASEQVPPQAARGRTYAYGDPIDRLINGRDVAQERADEIATHEYRRTRHGRYVRYSRADEGRDWSCRTACR